MFRISLEPSLVYIFVGGCLSINQEGICAIERLLKCLDLDSAVSVKDKS